MPASTTQSLGWYILPYVLRSNGVKVDRLSVTMDPDLGQAVRAAAARSGTSVSGWLSEAAAARVRNERLGAALDAWQAEDGPLGQDELDWAVGVLDVGRAGPRKLRHEQAR